MARGKRTNKEVKGIVKKMNNQGESQSKISKLTGLPRTTVHDIIAGAPPKKKLRKARKRSQKHLKVDVRRYHLAILAKKIKRGLSFMKIFSKNLGRGGLGKSYSTVRRDLKALGFEVRKKIKRPHVSEHHRIKRINFGMNLIKQCELYGPFLFSDEKRFKLAGPDKFQKFVVAPDEELCCLSKKDYLDRISIMVWAVICSKGLVTFEVVKCTIDGKYYREMIRERVFPKLVDNGLLDHFWVQDNAAPHKAKATVAMLTELNLKVVDWPLLSPDLNPVKLNYYQSRSLN